MLRSQFHLQEFSEMDMLYAANVTAVCPLVKADNVFRIIVADGTEIAKFTLER